VDNKLILYLRVDEVRIRSGGMGRGRCSQLGGVPLEWKRGSGLAVHSSLNLFEDREEGRVA
jgi:hypothetical protein